MFMDMYLYANDLRNYALKRVNIQYIRSAHDLYWSVYYLC